jgi:hypothetical protein
VGGGACDLMGPELKSALVLGVPAFEEKMRELRRKPRRCLGFLEKEDERIKEGYLYLHRRKID